MNSYNDSYSIFRGASSFYSRVKLIFRHLIIRVEYRKFQLSLNLSLTQLNDCEIFLNLLRTIQKYKEHSIPQIHSLLIMLLYFQRVELKAAIFVSLGFVYFRVSYNLFKFVFGSPTSHFSKVIRTVNSAVVSVCL